MRISDWSSDVCSSDLRAALPGHHLGGDRLQPHGRRPQGDAGMTAAPVLQIEGLTVCYRSGRRLLPAVQQFDLTLDAGEAYGLVGASGCCTSTVAFGVLGPLPENGCLHAGRNLVTGENVSGLAYPGFRPPP